jgi:hypothetical protein
MDGSMQRTQVKIRSVAKFYVNQKLCAWNGSRIKEKLQDDKVVLAFW